MRNKGHKIEDGKEYFIQDTRQVVGNCALWWRHNGCGYTTEIGEAGRYDAQEARSITRRKTDVAYECNAVLAVAVLHVRVDAPGGIAPLSAEGD